MDPFTDLDARPDHLPAVLALFAECGPGRDHAVCGEPSRMGRPPTAEDLRDTLGVLVATERDRVIGALAICPYSESQVTMWGPVVNPGLRRRGIGSALWRKARTAIGQGGFASLRVLVDQRNRTARAFCRAHGLTAWKDNRIYQRSLTSDLPAAVSEVGWATPAEHPTVARILADAFPDSAHCEQPLSDREAAGYRHPVIRHDNRVVGTAAVRSHADRSWLSLIAVDPACRGRGLASRLLAGILHLEADLGHTAMALEVLDDNTAAIALYESLHCERAWTATILTGPA